MKYALLNGNRVEALKGFKATCPNPNCKTELIAKCGGIKKHHWAHKGKLHCDPWWENETEWHRAWKNNYPSDWQEFSFLDEGTKEIHIADVRTEDRLVMEFQHSNINPNERIAREKFYKNMVWVIDGTRLKSDYTRFLSGLTNFHSTNISGVFHVDFLDECFHAAWIGSSVPVIFDFKGIKTIDDPNDPRNHLYCLLPKKVGRYNILGMLSRQYFIDTTTTGEWSSIIMNNFDRPNQNQQLQQGQGMQNIRESRGSHYLSKNGQFIKRKRL